MSGLLDQPAVVIVAAAAASILLLLEIALPTVGIAGSAGLAVGAIAVWGVARVGGDWWPLLGIVGAVALWGGLIAAHRAATVGQPVADVLFLAGALGYARITHDWTAAGTAVVSAALLAYVYPRIAAGAERLSHEKPVLGMDAYVGTTATVVDWDGSRGHVIAAGTRWSATGPAGLAEGDEVVITAASGLSLTVGSRHG